MKKKNHYLNNLRRIISHGKSLSIINDVSNGDLNSKTKILDIKKKQKCRFKKETKMYIADNKINRNACCC
jgi:hypothetical protein